MAATTTFIDQKSGPNLLIRGLWYVFIGWWATGLTMTIAWVAGLTVIGLPLSFWLINRIPTVLTLRPRHEQFETVVAQDGSMGVRRLETAQSSLLVRLVYFLLVGWWLSAIWMVVSYVISLTIIGIPIGLMMVNRLPMVFSLHRGYA